MQSSDNSTISHNKISELAKHIIDIKNLGIELAIVIGGGNIFRGHTYNGRNSGFIRTDADKMGMLATAINAIAIRSTFESCGIDTIIQSSVALEGIANRFSVTECDEMMKSGKVAIFCCGTGNPFFSTDSAAALRSCELKADILLKATNVDGVYDIDPNKNIDAKKYDTLSYQDVLQKNINVMDLTAFVLCMENNIPIRIFSLEKEQNIIRAISGEKVGTFIGK